MADKQPVEDGIRLSKDERKQLLAEIERDANRREPPERLIQRATAAIQSGQLDAARRLVAQVEAAAPSVAGLEALRQQLAGADQARKLRSRIQTAEDMLTRAIQQRKKPLAQMTLSALEELAPQHPRLGELRTWVRDLDQEVEQHARVQAVLSSGRQALQNGDLAAARQQLLQLQKLDPIGLTTEEFADEVDAAVRVQETNKDIGRLKQTLDTSIAAGRLEEAQQALEALAATGVPRGTAQTYARRLEEARRRQHENAEAQTEIDRFEEHLGQRQWQAAREIAQRFGHRFGDARSTQMFNRVAELEAADRRQQSIQQGIASLEQFIAQGKKLEAQLALKLLRSMSLDEARLGEFEDRVSRL
ncbi:MAG: hypothetical protein AAF725_02790 [Acidobacteriota bacterium]